MTYFNTQPQLFGLASWRKIECQFWAFNTQWDFGSKSLECAKLNILIKYVNNTCWNYFLVTLEMLGYHWKFFGGSRMARKARKSVKRCEKHGFFSTSRRGRRGQNILGLSWVYKSTTQKEKKWEPKIKNEKQFLCSHSFWPF